MKTKTCFKCNQVLPLSQFYKAKNMADGHLNKCRQCCREYSLEHRMANIDRIREYDRARGNRQSMAYVREYREKYPAKYKAHCMVNNALRDGRLIKSPCEICDEERSVAHHDDYAKPMEIRWLCQPHHKQWHAVHGEALNGRMPESELMKLAEYKGVSASHGH